MLSIDAVNAVQSRSSQLYSPEQINSAMDKMADQLTTDLAALNPLVLCVMVGGLIPTSMLMTRLTFPLQLDYVHATRYRHDTVGSELEWIALPRTELKDRTVLIVDDILDGGVTMSKIKEWCQEKQSKQVLTAVMIDKMTSRDPNGLPEADYAAIRSEDRFVYGFGLDYKGYLRNAPGIYAVAPEDQ